MIRNTRRVSWLKGALKDFRDFPADAQDRASTALTFIADGATPDIAKPLRRYLGRACVSEKIQGGHCNAEDGNRTRQGTDQAIEGDAAVTIAKSRAGKTETVRGSGNVFRDLGRPNAELLQLKALLAAEVVRTLDDAKLTVRRAQSQTGIAAADFSRIRNAGLSRFTVDRLMTILDRLGRDVDVAVTVRKGARQGNSAAL